MEAYTLINGVHIPKIGFGTWKLADGDEAYKSVSYALEVGYRHVDTAQYYGNEVSVGRAIADSPIKREELFITTKIWNDKHSYDEAKQSVEESLAKLKLNYLDLLLIHWPNPKALRENDAWKTRNADVWRAMEDLYQAGKVRAIGVSNFMIHHLEPLLEVATVKPMVNQVLLALGCSQEDLVAFCRQNEMILEAYSPLGTGSIFDNQTAQDLANKYNKTVAQIALRWSLQKGFLPLPKSATPKNILSNLAIFDFDLTEDDILKLDKIENVKSQGNPDETAF
ncbi:aldo/keto reductase [Streptococcus mutans]|uniref:aldo/keto reductase n=1 Tax=Streptococcus mutans TaxID=1309 RepID=UPI0002B55F79|nr:aldo/keto reductase [Streptococcus mutans]EMC50546.1 putative reductase [Streptococcus mutans SA38]MCB4930083.1 aldo/keto reductase [Streptococcus mutans]MCB4950930.1 aldo/keto reductase [Streptococcus mutans]MCB5006299.1 aldo/keto reductase [Streptococcus mutans]MCB5028487.1 aldo/keto reductase [Streptococcus mutans]